MSPSSALGCVDKIATLDTVGFWDASALQRKGQMVQRVRTGA